ncbi:MAG: ABC transporter permease, partial [Acidipropionibacterium jensenii]|nr:ABC transporter permease [Acidipropionibacterium jensenii]
SLRAWGEGVTQWWPLLSLAVWTAVLGFVAHKVFRWVS